MKYPRQRQFISLTQYWGGPLVFAVIIYYVMRRSSYTPLPTEPLIVVEEAAASEEDEAVGGDSEAQEVSCHDEGPSAETDDEDDPGIDPALLCPWRDPRDLRKRSLPTPQCTSGITASQVRRLSERSAATARESAFLATLTSAPAPGRRHSVTISRLPPTAFSASIFQRGRRESIAAFPSNRRDSASFNLHLDIMDDIAEIKGARKAKMKLYKTSSKEQVCEIEDGSGMPVRFQSPVGASTSLQTPHSESRRHSEAAGLVSLQPPPIPPRRKASEQFTTGIVCTNYDLVTLLSLTSSAQDVSAVQTTTSKAEQAQKIAEPKRSKLKDARSNSFDMAMLGDKSSTQPKKVSPSSWFSKRHQAKCSDDELKAIPPLVTLTSPQCNQSEHTSITESGTKEEVKQKSKASKVLWDKPSGSVVDAQLLGSAIEVYLRRGESATPVTSPSSEPITPQQSSDEKSGSSKEATCDTPTSSICSTLKDLFVK